MGILNRFTRTKYNDQEIVHRIETAIVEDPMIVDHGNVDIKSSKGVVTLSGFVRKSSQKDRIEGLARSTLRDANLKFEQFDNKIEVHA